jgi:hypothetical protein
VEYQEASSTGCLHTWHIQLIIKLVNISHVHVRLLLACAWVPLQLVDLVKGLHKDKVEHVWSLHYRLVGIGIQLLLEFQVVWVLGMI